MNDRTKDACIDYLQNLYVAFFMKKEYKTMRIGEKLADAANLPKDVVMGAAVVTVLGSGEMYIENYRGIIEYTDSLIRVQTKNNQIRLSGTRLQMEYYTNDEIKSTGCICSIEFCT